MLITGASGFTGMHLIPVLRNLGYETVGLGRSHSSADADIKCDINNSEDLKKNILAIHPTHAIHLAGISFVNENDARAYYDINLFGTLNLLESLASLPKAPIKTIVASSANVYGAPSVEQIEESICPAPINHYACSKLAMEHMVRTWYGKLKIVQVRPFNYTGSGQNRRFIIPKIVDHFVNRKEQIELGNIDVRRDYSDVRDVVTAYAKLLESDVHSDEFNICSGKAYSLYEILNLAGMITGHKLAIRINQDLIRENEISVLRGSNRKLNQYVGYAPQYDFFDTLEWIIRESISTTP